MNCFCQTDLNTNVDVVVWRILNYEKLCFKTWQFYQHLQVNFGFGCPCEASGNGNIPKSSRNTLLKRLLTLWSYATKAMEIP